MSNKNVSGLIAHCLKAQKENWQYVYGAKGDVTSKKTIENLQEIYGKSLVWVSDLKKAGKICCDCSGLISSYTGIIRNSTSYYENAKEVLNLSAKTWTEVKKKWKNYVGYAIWRKGHIGVLSDKEGYYMAMDGSADNFVEKKVDYCDWVCIFRICDISYEKTQENVAKKESKKYFKKPEYQGYSIVDALKAVGVDSSYTYRCKIAEKNGILNYYGNLNQNTKMLDLLKKGKLIKP